GYLTVNEAPRMPSAQQPLFGPGGMAKEAAQQVQCNLTDKGIDFLGYRTLKHLLGSIGKSSFGAHDTEHLATGIEAEAASKQYEYGDVLNLDVNATLLNAIKREGLGVPINLEYRDLRVHQAEYRSSSATVLMLDCSHSPRRSDLRHPDGARSADHPGHLPRGGAVPPQRDPDQHLHAGARPQSRGVREEGVGDLPREGLFHEQDDAGAVHPDGLHAEKDSAGLDRTTPTVAPVSPPPTLFDS